MNSRKLSVPAGTAQSAVCVPQMPVIPLLSKGQKDFLAMPRKERIEYFADKDKRLELVKDGSCPLSFKINAKTVKDVAVITFLEPADKSTERKETLIGGTRITAPAYVLVEKEKNGAISFSNLKIAKTYQWKCGAREETFLTEDTAPRLLKIHGIPNSRDLGGRMTLYGKRVKQGIVYRTAGLNDNALPVRKTVTKAQLEADNGYLLKVRASMEKRIAKDEALLKQNVNVKLVPYSLKKVWTVYLPVHEISPSDHAILASLKTLPPELFGGKAFTMKADAEGKMTFPEPQTGKPSVFCQIFDSPADGTMQIGTGADWFYAVFVNGEIYLDLLETGNGKSDRTANDNVINVQVKKGKNIIVIPLLSGAASWSLAVNKTMHEVPYKFMLKQELTDAQNVMTRLTAEKTGGYLKGRDRLDDETQKYLTQDLGVHSDIDLRDDNECGGMTFSPVGEDVAWFHVSSSSYGGMQTAEGKNALAKVFRVFLEEKNYPILFHCSAGQDRTGAVAFIINALLGIPEEQLYLDWEVTAFWNSSISFNHKDYFNKLVAGFDSFPGKTIGERVENYVLSLGFTQKDIAKLRRFMLEE